MEPFSLKSLTIKASSLPINDLFDSMNGDFSSISNIKGLYCDKVQHTTKLKVNKKGIEGAAVTAMAVAGAVGPGPYTEVYEDFPVDRAFAYILTDNYDIPLFMGVVNK